MKRWLFLLLMLLGSPALADYKRSYQDGLNAVEKREWARARTAMQAAIAEEPKPAARLRLYGMRYVPYVPHYYLGLAAFQAGDCGAALAAFAEPSHRQLVLTLDLGAEQQRMEQQCQARLAQRAPAESASPTPVASPPVASTPTAPAPAPPAPRPTPVAPPPTPPAAPSWPPAALADVKQRLARTEQSLSRLTSGAAAAELAALDGRARLQSQLDERAKAVAQMRSRLSQSEGARDANAIAGLARELAAIEAGLAQDQRQLDALRSAQRSAADLALAQAALAQSLDQAQQTLSTWPGDSAERRALAQAIGSAEQARGGRELRSIGPARVKLDQALASARRALAAQQLAERSRTLLRPQLERFLKGDYLAVSKWMLETETEGADLARTHALWLRAAARYQLFVLSGEQALELRTGAENDLRAAARLSARFQPPARIYSPRFLAFAANVR